MKISGGELPQTFVRAEPVVPSELKTEKLSEYTGRYGSDELAHDVEIRLEGSHLVAGPVGGAARSAPEGRNRLGQRHSAVKYVKGYSVLQAEHPHALQARARA